MVHLSRSRVEHGHELLIYDYAHDDDQIEAGMGFRVSDVEDTLSSGKAHLTPEKDLLGKTRGPRFFSSS